MINNPKPTSPSLLNTAKASFAELWSTITTTWETETRTWLETGSLLVNLDRPFGFGLGTEDLLFFLTTEDGKILAVEPTSNLMVNTPKP
jgi:hypothetical protein